MYFSKPTVIQLYRKLLRDIWEHYRDTPSAAEVAKLVDLGLAPSMTALARHYGIKSSFAAQADEVVGTAEEDFEDINDEQSA